MKKVLSICLAAICIAACQKPEFIESNADRQGLTSFTAYISSGTYAGQELARIEIDAATYASGVFDMEIPYFYPETSEDGTLQYMTALRIQAELQPNFKISPGLGLLDMTEPHEFTLTDPKGNSRTITLTARRVKPKACSLITFLIEDYMVSGIIYEDTKEILIPYLEDLSSVSVSGQVSSHAKISKISGAAYVKGAKYNMNTGATVTVLAGNGTTSQTYSVRQGIPQLIPSGLNPKSISPLFNIDAVTIAGLPAYTEEAFISLAGLGDKLIVGTGCGRAPYFLNCYTGQNLGQIAMGSAVADALTSDEAGNLIMCNFAQGGASAETVNLYVTNSETTAPTLYHSFTNPCSEPIGHRIKVMGDLKGSAVIVMTAEGIAGVTTTAKAVVLYVEAGAVVNTVVEDFSSVVAGWGSAPINAGTIVPASTTPAVDGWFLDYYEGNCDPVEGLYYLHYITGTKKDNIIGKIGDWGNNPNCLDSKVFNHNSYMTLFVVSHFPHWGRPAMLYLYDTSDPSTPSLVASNEAIKSPQEGSYDPTYGACGDVVLYPTTDGYRVFIFYYDHHCQAIGAYVADCFKK